MAVERRGGRETRRRGDAAAGRRGGGLRTGQVIGATDRHGGESRGTLYNPQNLLATLYHLLDIDPAATLPDHSGRPQYLVDHRTRIAELL
jgi:Protein of unknown function (DUF1501)